MTPIKPYLYFSSRVKGAIKSYQGNWDNGNPEKETITISMLIILFVFGQ